MKSNDKWLMFKNYMHNELGITKEDIRNWLKEAIEQEAKILVAKTYDDFSINDIIDKYVMDRIHSGNPNLKREIKAALVTAITDRISFIAKEDVSSGEN